MKFTDVYIRNLKPQQKWFEQIEFSGLGIRVMPGGGKSWIFRFTFDGKRYKMTLGKYPGIGLKEARELMLDAERLKEQGINPIEHAKQQQAKSDNTVKKLALSWYTHYVEKHLKRPLTVKNKLMVISLCFLVIGFWMNWKPNTLPRHWIRLLNVELVSMQTAF